MLGLTGAAGLMAVGGAGVGVAEWVTQAAAARAVGVSPPALSKWIRNGQLVPAADRRVDMAHVRAVAAQLDPARSPAARAAQSRALAGVGAGGTVAAGGDGVGYGVPADGGGGAPASPPALSPSTLPPPPNAGAETPNQFDFQAERAAREHYAARDARLSYERACGQLIDAERAGMALTTAAANMRLVLEALPDRLAARVAAEGDEAACAALLEAAVGEALQALQDLAAALAADVAVAA